MRIPTGELSEKHHDWVFVLTKVIMEITMFGLTMSRSDNVFIGMNNDDK